MARPKKKEVRYRVGRVEHCADDVTGTHIKLFAAGNVEVLLELDHYAVRRLYEATKTGVENVAEAMENHATWLREKL